MTNGINKYNLVSRTEVFGKSILLFALKIPKNTISLPVISQFVRAGTSVGANYCEADNAESKNDFKHKIGISRKESKETIYWLKMITTLFPNLYKEIDPIQKEATELNLIFNAIIKSCDKVQI